MLKAPKFMTEYINFLKGELKECCTAKQIADFEQYALYAILNYRKGYWPIDDAMRLIGETYRDYRRAV